jgi:phosphatidylserine decarboxylase
MIVAIVSVILGLWSLVVLSVFVALFMAFFFRDPRREPPTDPNVVVAPADGKVTRVVALDENSERSPTLVSIFLSPLDVHINRAPIPGTIRDVVYSPGKFLMATNKNASIVNEQNVLTIQNDRITVVCKQIAGILARRIVCWKKTGDDLTLGERFGLIKFSSSTDVVLPSNVSVTVSEGQRVRGGVTVIGRIL